MWKMKVIFNILLLIVLTPCFLLKGQRMPDENFLLGKALMQQQKYDSALIALTLSKGTDSKNAETWLLSGKIAFTKKNYPAAVSDFLEAEKRKPGIASYMLAKVYARQNHINKSLEYLENHLRSVYKLPESKIFLDEDFETFENRKEWINFWNQGSYYSNFDKLLAEADYYYNMEDYMEALDILNQGLKKNYSEAPLMAKRAEIYSKLENHSNALKDLNSAIDKQKRDASLYSKRGEVNYILENYKAATEDFNQAVILDPGNFDLYLFRAKALAKTGQILPAVEDIRYYLNFFPEDDAAWFALGRINLEAEKYLDALRALNMALDYNPGNSRYFLARGESYFQTNTLSYANNDLAMALDLEPDNPDIYFLKGKVALKSGDKDHACFCFKKAYQLGHKEAFNFIGNHCK